MPQIVNTPRGMPTPSPIARLSLDESVPEDVSAALLPPFEPPPFEPPPFEPPPEDVLT